MTPEQEAQAIKEAQASLSRMRPWQRLTISALESVCFFGDRHRWFGWLVGCGGLIPAAQWAFELWDRWDPR